MTFTFGSKKVHLTYKGHVTLDQMNEWRIKNKFDEFQYHSLVWEEGDVDEENATPYNHTHFAAMWHKKQQRSGARIFDVGEIHPHIQTKNSIAWMEHIFTKYHHGFKVKKDGKKYFIEPIGIWQHSPPDWSGDIWDQIIGAPSLKAAAEIIDARPRSLADVKLIRSETIKRKFAEVESDCTDTWVEPPEEWNPKKQSLIIEGKPNIGKTNWAKHYFQGRGYEITELEGLKHCPEGATGLIFDDQEYALFKTQTQKMVADCRKATEVRTRHSNAYKPHLPAIFTTNNRNTLFDLNDEAIMNRVHLWTPDKLHVEN